MCGIYGRIGKRDDALDQRATRSLHHRGPDAAGLWIDTQSLADQVIALGHTRLAIVDLSNAGRQPMLSADGQLALVFNGEIYNFQTLRRRLEEAGRQFHSHSDTEVILHLYALHGDAMLEMLEGMFAIALWDRKKKRLLIARDPTGIKPLFWRETPHGVSFASEIKALLVDPQCPREPDVAALAGYLNYLYVPPPGTPFVGIAQLLPGHKLVIQHGKTQVERYARYSVTPKLPVRGLGDAANQLELLLQTVLAEHMVADVPVGAFLSGGIDSGLLVAMMQRLRQESGALGPLQTFTVGFGQEGAGLDETARAAQIAKKLGVAHEVLRVDANIAADGLQHVVQQFDAPFANPTALMIDVLCQQARKTVTVAVTGDGGDEAFGGYPRYRATWPLWAWQRLPETLRAKWLPELASRLPEGRDDRPFARRLRRFLTASGGTFAETYRDWLSQHTLPGLWDLLTPDALARVSTQHQGVPRDLGRTLAAIADLPPDTAPLDAACYADVLGFLPDNVLALSDRMSMRHALELRVPFADRRVLDFGLRLPVLLKSTPAALVGSSGKHAAKRVLRAVASRYVPQDVAKLPKQGFVAPMGAWLAGPLRPLAMDALSPDRLRARGLVRPEAVAHMQAEHAAGTRDHTWHLWSLVVLEQWFQARVDALDVPIRDHVALRVTVV
jgi:asparagine synthase (glutamine-hydrolysing)